MNTKKLGIIGSCLAGVGFYSWSLSSHDSYDLLGEEANEKNAAVVKPIKSKAVRVDHVDHVESIYEDDTVYELADPHGGRSSLVFAVSRTDNILEEFNTHYPLAKANNPESLYKVSEILEHCQSTEGVENKQQIENYRDEGAISGAVAEGIIEYLEPCEYFRSKLPQDTPNLFLWIAELRGKASSLGHGIARIRTLLDDPSRSDETDFEVESLLISEIQKNDYKAFYLAEMYVISVDSRITELGGEPSLTRWQWFLLGCMNDINCDEKVAIDNLSLQYLPREVEEISEGALLIAEQIANGESIELSNRG